MVVDGWWSLVGLLGRATESNEDKANNALRKILIDGEQVQASFVLYRDRFVFTNARLVILNSMGVGKEHSYRSIPYDMISSFEIRTRSLAGIDSVLTIWLVGDTQNGIELKFGNDDGVYKVQQVLATYCLGPALSPQG